MLENKKNSKIPEIIFTNDWHEIVQGDLVRGGKFKISYDKDRLPRWRATYSGAITWNIIAYVKFKEDGKIEDKVLNSGQREIMTQVFDIPRDAEKIIIWFKNSDRSGGYDYDSKYGMNYHFKLRE